MELKDIDVQLFDRELDGFHLKFGLNKDKTWLLAAAHSTTDIGKFGKELEITLGEGEDYVVKGLNEFINDCEADVAEFRAIK